MTPTPVIETKLQTGMVQGNMHACLRDVGRLAGGLYATGSLSGNDLNDLQAIAVRLAINKEEAQQKWIEAVEFGKGEPVKWETAEYHGKHGHGGKAFEWDDVIGNDSRIFDPRWIESEDLDPPIQETWSPATDLIKYLEALFESEDQVGYVTKSWLNEESGRRLPQKGLWDRSAGQLIEELSKCNDDIGRVIGDWDEEVGAWIRFNPVDGQGIKDANVTAFRFALIESDVVDIPTQFALIKELELPVATLTHSGGKSLHAIVRVDASSFPEYKERVNYLYDVCKKHGLQMDQQNRNPSRLSRMPGVTRAGQMQYLVTTNLGKSSWNEWKEWIEDAKDDLPEIEIDATGDVEPELAPVLIEDVLRKGHKMLLSGPSKAGKSYCLQQLAIAIAMGGKWLDWQCAKGKVLYVNLELDAKSNDHRFWNIRRHLGVKNNGNIDFWNLRGNSAMLDKLTPKLIRRSEKRGYIAIIIDPIYKVLTGDENSAEQMAHFCNQFDKICVQLGAATIYCHHHSKGVQGHKSSQDRSSGSGVFARDPDAVLDLIELVIDDSRRLQITQAWVRDTMHAELNKVCPRWHEDVPQDDALVPEKLNEWVIEQRIELPVEPVERTRKAAEMTSGWRVSGVLREFAPLKNRDIFFRHPIHIFDKNGLLKDAKPEGNEPPWKQAREKKEQHKKSQEEKDREHLAKAWSLSNTGEPVTVKQMAESIEITPKTIRNMIERSKTPFIYKNGLVLEKQSDE